MRTPPFRPRHSGPRLAIDPDVLAAATVEYHVARDRRPSLSSSVSEPSRWRDDPPSGSIRVAGTSAPRVEPPQVNLTRGDEIRPEPIRWLWPGWLARGKMHVLGGAPGAGKTTLALRMAATMTTGGAWPDGTISDACNVIVWSGEDDPGDTLAPRLIASGADMGRVFFISSATEAGRPRPFDPAKDMGSLETAIRANGGAALVIVDPIVSAVAADTHKNGEVRRALQPLVDLGASIGAAVLGVTHFSKGTNGRDPTERITGSLAFGALARVVMIAAKKTSDDGDEGPPARVLMRAKSNIGNDEGGHEYAMVESELSGWPGVRATCIEWGAPIEGHARDVLADIEKSAGEPAEGGAVDRAATFLRALLAGGPMASDAIKSEAEGAGLSWAAIRRAKALAGVKTRREGFGGDGAWLWEIDQ